VLPAGFTYHAQLSQGALAAKTLGVSAPQLPLLEKLAGLLGSIQTKRTALESAMEQVERASTEEAKADLFARSVTGVMSEIRSAADELETVVADELWPLPKYREMLYLS
jgi:glutamine synthetase